MRKTTRKLAGLLAAGLLAACGDAPIEESAEAEPSEAADGSEAAGNPPVDSTAAAKLGETELGPVLTDTDGMTLYGFTNDVDATSTCTNACAEAWPPLLVDENWDVSPGVDIGIFGTTTRDDGSLQLVAGRWPVYSYAGDAAPGDVNGQGSGDVWFAVAPDGTLIRDEEADSSDSGDGDESTDGPYDPEQAGPAVEGATIEGEDVLVDGNGFTLYGFTEDTDGEPTCEDACAGTWPPLTVEGDPELAEALAPGVFTTVERSDGTHQVVAGDWPVYRFSGDGRRGDANGQGSGDVWFMVRTDGSLVR